MSHNQLFSLTRMQSEAVRYSPADMERLARQYRAEALGAGIADVVVALVKGVRFLAAAYRRWDERQQTIADLQRLDDRCLADIGIEREEIAGFAAGQTARHDADEHLYVAGTAPVRAANTQNERRVAIVAA
jgi:uncharacterized protein YjiS (DUF1127 family)